MKKLLFLLVLFTVLLSVFPCNAAVKAKVRAVKAKNSSAAVKTKYIQIGDKWVVLLDYGEDSNGVPFAVLVEMLDFGSGWKTRKDEVILFLTLSGVSPEVASNVHRVDYYYEYTSDGKQCALIKTNYCGYYGGTASSLYSASSVYSVEETSKNFTAIPANSPMEKAVKYVFGKNDQRVIQKNKTSKNSRSK